MYAGDHRLAYITIENDGDESDTFKVDASAGSEPEFNIAYFVGRTSTNVTVTIEAGAFTTPSLAPGASYRLRVRVMVNTLTTQGFSYRAAGHQHVGCRRHNQ